MRRRYYRNWLDKTDPAADLASRIRWVASQYAPPTFILVFGGLGLYGGHDDFFLFLQARCPPTPGAAGRAVPVGCGSP